MKQYILDLITGGVGAMVLSAAARSLPEPVPMGSRWYLWLYRFSQTLLANWDLRGRGSALANSDKSDATKVGK